jgi:excisionase family DNA binding protein
MNNPFEELKAQQDRIENLLLEIIHRTPHPEAPASDKLLNVAQAGKLLNLTRGSLYGKVHKGEIPYCKQGKHLYFSEKELRSWVMSGRRQTLREIESDVLKSLSN